MSLPEEISGGSDSEDGSGIGREFVTYGNIYRTNSTARRQRRPKIPADFHIGSAEDRSQLAGAVIKPNENHGV